MNRKMRKARQRKSAAFFVGRLGSFITTLSKKITSLKDKEYLAVDTREPNILIFLRKEDKITSIEVKRDLVNLFCQKIEKEGFTSAD